MFLPLLRSTAYASIPLALLLSLAGCTDQKVEFCLDDQPCTPSPVTCGDSVIEGSEVCDDGENNGSPNACNVDCTGTTPAVCGNGVVETGEVCDDGDDNGTFGHCNADCTGLVTSLCGDSVIEGDEVCDDGENNGSPNACNVDCTGTTPAVCGNGVVETGEVCDDGDDNGTPNACSADCTGVTPAVCGNGILEADELCDDGDDNGAPNGCSDDCTGVTPAVCGNGVLEADEICDDGDENGTVLGECNLQCDGPTISICGNGILEILEECDDAGESATCTSVCTISTCGDGIVNASAGETCDSGASNGQPNKCNLTCDGVTPSQCGNGVREIDEACDDGTNNGQPNFCNTTCTGITPSVCGNSIIEAGETCDAGANNGQPNGCNDTCTGITPSVCGNGIIEAGETCDDPDRAWCSPTCQAFDTALRLTEAKIIDPRIYYDVPLRGCRDMTNIGIGGGLNILVDGANGEIKRHLVENLDGFYRLNIAAVFRHLRRSESVVTEASIEMPRCVATPGGTCTRDLTKAINFVDAQFQATGSCLTDLVGRNPQYTGLHVPTGPCIITQPATIEVTVAELDMILVDAQLVATLTPTGNAATTGLTNGVLKGFLREEDAKEIRLPAYASSLAGTPIAHFLGGGPKTICKHSTYTNNRQDLDIHNGERGWWFYINVKAATVPWVE